MKTDKTPAISFGDEGPRTTIAAHEYPPAFMYSWTAPHFCISVKARVFNRSSAALFSLGLRWRYITFYSQPLKSTTLFLLFPNAAARRRAYFLKVSVNKMHRKLVW